MSTYLVTATRECSFSTMVSVEANSPEQARELAYDLVNNVDTNWEASDSWLTKPDIDLWNVEPDNDVCPMTVNQMWGLWRKFKQNPDGSPTFMLFMQRAIPMLMDEGGLMIYWCGMWLGIEHDSYGEAHS